MVRNYNKSAKELNVDETFPTLQFVKNNFTESFRLNFTINGRSIILYIKNNITVTLLPNYTLPEDIKALFVKIVTEKFKWLFCCSYNSYKGMITHHL